MAAPRRPCHGQRQRRYTTYPLPASPWVMTSLEKPPPWTTTTTTMAVPASPRETAFPTKPSNANVSSPLRSYHGALAVTVPNSKYTSITIRALLGCTSSSAFAGTCTRRVIVAAAPPRATPAHDAWLLILGLHQTHAWRPQLLLSLRRHGAVAIAAAHPLSSLAAACNSLAFVNAQRLSLLSLCQQWHTTPRPPSAHSAWSLLSLRRYKREETRSRRRNQGLREIEGGKRGKRE